MRMKNESRVKCLGQDLSPPQCSTMRNKYVFSPISSPHPTHSLAFPTAAVRSLIPG